MRIGWFLSCEEYAPVQLIEQARMAAEAGFSSLWISDHFHPWNKEQGQSPFVWSMIGALSAVTDLPVMTAVTCPIIRTHPAVIAQAAATSAVMTNGRFILGVGTGEALNEHITGAPWPPWEIRAEMLSEAVALMRRLWTGEVVTHRGSYYSLDNARIFTLPDSPPPVYVSGFGPRAIELAADIGDGFISTRPDKQAVQTYLSRAGRSMPVRAGTKGCWAPTEDEARKIAHRLWPTEALNGELSQVLPTPEHFEQAAASVDPEDMPTPLGPDPDTYVRVIDEYADAGFDELNVAPIGPYYRELIELFGKKVLN
jgi:G6PDH family F420-dependent oxidoreductase